MGNIGSPFNHFSFRSAFQVHKVWLYILPQYILQPLWCLINILFRPVRHLNLTFMAQPR